MRRILTFWRAKAGPEPEPFSLTVFWKENTLRYRIRELNEPSRRLIGLIVMGRPAEPEPKRERCSAGPTKLFELSEAFVAQFSF